MEQDYGQLVERFQRLSGIKPIYKAEIDNEYQEVVDILTEVHIQTLLSNGVLKENISEGVFDKIKSGFKNLKDQSKSFIKKNLELVKKKGVNPTKFLTDIVQSAKGVNLKSSSELIRALQVYLTKASLQEVDKGEFSKIGQLKNLKGGDTFKWEGSDLDNANFNNLPIENLKGRSGLYKGASYIVLNGMEEGEFSIPPTIVSQKYYEDVQTSPSGMWIRKVFEKHPWLSKTLQIFFGALGVISIGAGVMNPTIALASGDMDVAGLYGPSGGLAGEDIQGVLGGDDAPEIGEFESDASDNILDADTELESGVTFDKITSPEEVADDIKSNKVAVGDMDLSDDENTALEAQTYEVGEGHLSDTEVDKASKQLVEKVLDDLNSMFDKAEGKSLSSITLTIDAEAGISYNGGDQSNVANDGGDLLQQRLESSEKVANAAVEDIKEIVKNTFGDEVEVNVKINQVDTSPGVEDQTQQKTQDFLGTQSSMQSANVGIETSEEEGATPTALYYQFLYAKRGGTKDIPVTKKGDEGSVKKDKEEKTTTLVTPPKKVTKDQTTKDIKDFGSLRRNGQLAVILRTISPDNLSLYKELGIDDGDDFTNSQISNLITDENESEKARFLADSISYMRKNPNAFLKKFSDITGLDLSVREKMKMVRPGVASSTKREFHEGEESLQELNLMGVLTEAKIDTILDKYKNEIIANKFALLGLIGTMFAQDKSLGTVSIAADAIEGLPNDQKEQAKKFGFTPLKDGSYVALSTLKGKGEEEKAVEQPRDVQNIMKRILKDKKGQVDPILRLVKTPEALTALVLGTVKHVEFAEKLGKNAILLILQNIISKLEKEQSGLSEHLDLKLKSILQEIIKEAEDPKSVVDFFDVIDKDTMVKQFFTRIDKKDELEELLYAMIKSIPYFNDIKDEKTGKVVKAVGTPQQTVIGVRKAKEKFAKEFEKYTKGGQSMLVHPSK